MLTEISFEKAKLWVDSQGILNCKHFNSNFYWKLRSKEINKYLLAILTLAGNKPRSIIIDFRNVRGIYSILAARLFVRDSSVNRIIISEAFVVNSMAIGLLIAVYEKIYEPNIPFKVFNNIKSAQKYSIKQMESIKQNNYEVESSHLI